MNVTINVPIMTYIAKNGKRTVNVRKIPNIWTFIVPNHVEFAKTSPVRMTINSATIGLIKAIARVRNTLVI